MQFDQQMRATMREAYRRARGRQAGIGLPGTPPPTSTAPLNEQLRATIREVYRQTQARDRARDNEAVPFPEASAGLPSAKPVTAFGPGVPYAGGPMPTLLGLGAEALATMPAPWAFGPPPGMLRPFEGPERPALHVGRITADHRPERDGIPGPRQRPPARPDDFRNPIRLLAADGAGRAAHPSLPAEQTQPARLPGTPAPSDPPLSRAQGLPGTPPPGSAAPLREQMRATMRAAFRRAQAPTGGLPGTPPPPEPALTTVERFEPRVPDHKPTVSEGQRRDPRIPGDAFRAAIIDLESDGKLNAINPASNELGLYQLGPGILKDIGAINPDGTWNPNYYPGIGSAADFIDPGNLQARAAQEEAFSDAMREFDRQLSANGARRHVGQRIEGIVAPFTITESSLRAAAHRGGAGGVRQYLYYQERNGWKSDFSGLPTKTREMFEAIETRLRELKNATYD